MKISFIIWVYVNLACIDPQGNTGGNTTLDSVKFSADNTGVVNANDTIKVSWYKCIARTYTSSKLGLNDTPDDIKE